MGAVRRQRRKTGAKYAILVLLVANIFLTRPLAAIKFRRKIRAKSALGSSGDADKCFRPLMSINPFHLAERGEFGARERAKDIRKQALA